MPIVRHARPHLFFARSVPACIVAALVAACGGGGEGGTVPPTTPPSPAPVASVAVSPDSAAVMEGQSATFSASTRDASGATLSGRGVAWSVSDPSLASLSASGASAQVTALKPGLVTVTATSEGRSATARFLVRPVPVASIVLDAGALQLIAGRTRQLVATARDSAGKALAGRAVSWSSGATGIATVSATGLVTAVAPGTTTITATAEGKVATATVVVTAAAPSGTWGMATEFAGTYWTAPAAKWGFIAYAEPGDFNGDGLTDFAMASFVLSTNAAEWGSDAGKPTPPLRIFLQRAGGGFEEASARLTGAEIFTRGQQPIVADLNRDGIDDIVLMGWTDFPVVKAPGLALVSSGTGFTRVTLPTEAVHGGAVSDADNDGCLDIIMPAVGNAFLKGDCAGNFATRQWTTSGAGWVTGMHACLADFNGDGRKELLLPDAYTNEPPPVNDLVIYEIDWTTTPVQVPAIHRLPVPVWDRGNTSTTKRSHDQRCQVGDLDGDGRLDAIVSATPNAVDGVAWQDRSMIQVYLNKGAWNFDEATDRAFPGRSDATASSFTLALRDLNGDGKLDLLYPAESPMGIQSNQVWMGRGDGTFVAASGVDFAALIGSARAAVAARRAGATLSASVPAVIPMPRRDGRYDFAVPVLYRNAQGLEAMDIEFSRVGWVFP